MRLLLKFLAAFVIAVLIGLGSLYYMTFVMRAPQTVTNGIWHTNPDLGTAANDPYSRFQLAVTSILGLNKSETIYYQAGVDQNGKPLSSACDYVLRGSAPEARWWSITAYGPDDLLINTQGARYSASAASVLKNPDGTIEIALTPDGSGPNGIATGAGKFVLVLRLYQPGASVRSAPESVPLFTIETGNCRA